MPMIRFACEKYASLEINRASFLKTGMVVSQTPLAETFTDAAPCENGMWVNADKAKGKIGPAAAATDLIGIVYTAEKEYSPIDIGLKNFYQVGGDYPRVGVLSVGDTFTTNCIQFDNSEFAAQTNLEQALGQIGTTPLYVVLEPNSAIPKITKTAAASGICGSVIKYYTMPNGEKAIKYNIIRL